MKIHPCVLPALWLALASLLADAAEVVVIANAASGPPALTRKQVADIYLGRAQQLPDGQPAMPLDNGHEPLRGQFYQTLTGRPEALIDAYWARLYFAGQQPPPRRLNGDADVIEAVARKKGAIGFVAPASLTDAAGVSVVLKME